MYNLIFSLTLKYYVMINLYDTYSIEIFRNMSSNDYYNRNAYQFASNSTRYCQSAYFKFS